MLIYWCTLKNVVRLLEKCGETTGKTRRTTQKTRRDYSKKRGGIIVQILHHIRAQRSLGKHVMENAPGRIRIWKRQKEGTKKKKTSGERQRSQTRGVSVERTLVWFFDFLIFWGVSTVRKYQGAPKNRTCRRTWIFWLIFLQVSTKASMSRIRRRTFTYEKKRRTHDRVSFI